jgi:hypothetical protein
VFSGVLSSAPHAPPQKTLTIVVWINSERRSATAFSDAAGGPIGAHGPCDAPRIYTPVAIEAPVLDAENGLDERVGKIPRLTASLSGPTRPSGCPFAASTNTDGPSMATRFSSGTW